MADVVPAAIGLLEPACARGSPIVQQAREEDLDRVRDAYASLSVAAEVAPFFPDLPARMAASHLIVARSGASTVAELSAIGRPAILVPLPHALDQDQFANAGVLRTPAAPFGWRRTILPRGGSPPRSPRSRRRRSGLAAMAAAARSFGRLDAADRLADLVLKVAARGANK